MDKLFCPKCGEETHAGVDSKCVFKKCGGDSKLETLPVNNKKILMIFTCKKCKCLCGVKITKTFFSEKNND